MMETTTIVDAKETAAAMRELVAREVRNGLSLRAQLEAQAPTVSPAVATTVAAFVELVATLDACAEMLEVREALSGAENLLCAVQHAGDLWEQAEAHGPTVAHITYSLAQEANKPSHQALALLLDVYLIKQSGIAGTTADGVYQRLYAAIATPEGEPTA